MPVRRDADGNIIDERTRLARKSGADPEDDDTGAADFLRPVKITRPRDARDGSPRPSRGDSFSDSTTPVTDRTVLYRPGQRTADGPMANPPAGWLVVIAGPGKGSVVTLGMGVNSIGRDRAADVSLDYGDTMISRTNHATITYDPRGRKFYVQHGGGNNLTYINDEPVLAPRELEPLMHVHMGVTVLRFVPLCGVGFAWEDESKHD